MPVYVAKRKAEVRTFPSTSKLKNTFFDSFLLH